jgi:hypothetical protein
MKFRVLKKDDYSSIAELLSNWFGGSPQNWKNRFYHWWEQNPAFEENMISGWVLETESKDIPGFLGNIPRLFKLGDKHVISGISSSMYVKDEYRHHSLKMFYTSLAETPFRLAVGMPEKLRPMHDRLGFKKVPLDSFNRTIFWVLDSRKFVKSISLFKGVPLFLSSLMGWLGALPLSVVNRGWCKWDKIRNIELRVEEVTECGSEFDELWNRVSRHYSAISVRTAKVLNWCYGVKENGVLKHNMLACVDGKSISGYAVYRLVENPRLHLKRLQIVDIFVESQKKDVVLALLNSIVNAGIKLGAVTVEVTGGAEWIEQTFKSTRPFIRNNPVVQPYYLVKNSTLSEKLENSDAWYITDFDSDAVL